MSIFGSIYILSQFCFSCTVWIGWMVPKRVSVSKGEGSYEESGFPFIKVSLNLSSEGITVPGPLFLSLIFLSSRTWYVKGPTCSRYSFFRSLSELNLALVRLKAWSCLAWRVLMSNGLGVVYLVTGGESFFGNSGRLRSAFENENVCFAWGWMARLTTWRTLWLKVSRGFFLSITSFLNEFLTPENFILICVMPFLSLAMGL